MGSNPSWLTRSRVADVLISVTIRAQTRVPASNTLLASFGGPR